jgi:DNA replication protein DnaC
MNSLSALRRVIPDEYRNFELEDMMGDPVVIEPIKATVKDYVENLNRNEKNGASLLIYGTANGTGKTWVAYYVLKKAQEPRLKWSREEQVDKVSCTNVVSIRCFDYIKYATNFDPNFFAATEYIKTCPFLLLDELSPGAFKNNSTIAQEELTSLIDHRVSFNLPTIITSNCADLAALKLLTGPTLFSRLTYKATPVNFTGPDVRSVITKQLKEELQSSGENQ